MKHLLLIPTLLITLLFTPLVDCFAQQYSDVQSALDEISNKYEGSQEVTCMTVVKGKGLGLVKMGLGEMLDKELLKHVVGITIIEYTKASEETRVTLSKDLETFYALLQEVDFGEEEFAKEVNGRCFFFVPDPADSEALSYVVFAVDNDEAKMLLCMVVKEKGKKSAK